MYQSYMERLADKIELYYGVEGEYMPCNINENGEYWFHLTPLVHNAFLNGAIIIHFKPKTGFQDDFFVFEINNNLLRWSANVPFDKEIFQ